MNGSHLQAMSLLGSQVVAIPMDRSSLATAAERSCTVSTLRNSSASIPALVTPFVH